MVVVKFIVLLFFYPSTSKKDFLISLPVSPFVEATVEGVPASNAAKSTRALDNLM